MFNLNGKNVLVAGGAGYLGLPLCEAIQNAGGKVFIADANPESLALAMTALDCEGHVFDIASEDSITATIAKATRALGPLHGLVNATAGSTAKTFDTLTPAEFDRANRANTTGPFLLARAAAEHMPQGGAMVFFASMYGLVSPDPSAYPPPMPPNPIEYGAGKAAILQMTRYMAGHFGPRDIRVNAIAPGPFPHKSVQEQHAGFVAGLAQRTMLKRLGAQHECAGPVTFLLSDAASYVTGQCLPVDGGWTAW